MQTRKVHKMLDATMAEQVQSLKYSNCEILKFVT